MKYCPVRLPGHRNPPSLRKEGGAVAILVAVSMVVLLGMVGLALDLGKLYVAKSELQNSADACALAAARELTGQSSGQLTLAETAGIRAGKANNVLFQGAAVKLNVDDSVQFSQTLSGGYQPQNGISSADALLIKYVQCTVQETGITNWLIPILNLLPGIAIGASQTVGASAVASLGASQTFSCPISMSVCASDIASAAKGTWISRPLTTPPGCQGWVNFQGNGAASIGNSLTDSCAITDLPALNTQVAASGCKTSLADDWNTRFGLYFGNNKKPPTGTSIPDYTGFSYYPGWNGVPASPGVQNKITDYLTQITNKTPFQPLTPAQEVILKPKIASQLSQPQHKTLGQARRIGIVAVVDCPSGTTVTDWACVLMLHPLEAKKLVWLEYLGKASDPGSPCATSGVPGGPSGIGPLVPTLVR